MQKRKIGVVAGSGRLPYEVINSFRVQGIDFNIVFIGEPNQLLLESLNEEQYILSQIGQVGKILSYFTKENIKEVLFIGRVPKPKFSEIKVDLLGGKLLSKITKNKLLGDNNIFKTIFAFIENKGFSVIGTKDLDLSLHLKKGVYGLRKVSKTVISDVEVANDLLNLISDFDIGQSLVIQSGRIIGIEAAEGTDNLLHRCHEFIDNNSKNPAILVKSIKKGQDVRADLPTIGFKTINNLIKNGYGGVAIEASSTIVLEQEKIWSKIEGNQFFIYAY